MHIRTIRPGASEVARDAWDDIDLIALLDHDDSAELIYTHGVQIGEEKAGVGYAMDPPRFLQDGDRVTCEIERIGRLTNVVRDVSAAASAA